jgi:2',3'-cyclic-nucleotide 2'-phosphodiesterase (5'-nucleotidase family)
MSNGDTADWFEVTNYGDASATITGYRMDDSSFANVTTSVALNNVTTIAPGESVVFLEGNASAATTFKTNWSLDGSKQVGYYSGSGVGLGSGGDGVTLFTETSANSGTELTGPFSGLIRVSFGAATSGTSFNWSYDAAGNSTSPATGQLTTTASTWSNASVPMIGTPGVPTPNAPASPVSIAAASINEGNSGTVVLNLPVSRTDSFNAFTVDYAVTGGTATSGTDYVALSAGTLTFTSGGANSQNIAITINGDTVIESSETITVTLSNLVVTTGQATLATASASGTITNDDAVPLAFPATNAFTSTVKGSIALAGSEIPAFDPLSKRAFASSNAGIQVVDLTDPAAPTLITTIAPSSLGVVGLTSDDVSSVAVRKGTGGNPSVLAAAIITTKPTNGYVIFLNAADGSLLGSIVVGSNPDHINFTPDGTKLLVANEGELDGGSADVAADTTLGTVSIINLAAGFGSLTSTTADFTAFDTQVSALRSAGVRIFKNAGGTDAVPSKDFEPEYFAISADSTKALVTLQEANAVAVLDIATSTFTSVKPLGKKDFSTLRADFSDRDGAGASNLVNPATGSPVFGLYMPDAIASYSSGGQTYYVTANEGDDRNDFLTPDETTTVSNSGYDLDDTVFPNETTLKANAVLGRLGVVNTLGNRGDTDGDGDIDEIQMLGARSFSILDAAGNRVFDSGDMIEMIMASQHLANFDDGRSDNKGPEPEGVTVASFGGRSYAFVGLERSGMVLAFDVTNPAAVTYTTSFKRTGDQNPEGMVVVSAADSPSGKPLLLTANETSNTLTIFEIDGAPTADYTLQILHYYGESGLLGIQTAPIMGAMIDKFDNDYANTIVVGEGDSFIPGPWLVAGADPTFNRLLHTGTFTSAADTTATPFAQADVAIMNLFGTTVSALGNHEYDLGSPVLSSALFPATSSTVGNWAGAQFPLITANLDFAGDSSLKSRADTTLGGTGGAIAGSEVTALKAKIAPYAIKTINGQRIGFVGATTWELLSKSSPNGTVPKDDANGATSDLQEVAAYLQTAVNALQALGVNKVVMVDQLDTLQRNKDLAGLVSGIDVVVAGGGHERMGDATDTAVAFNGHDANFISDAYPILTAGADSKPVLIVTSDTEYSYLGRLVVDFDANGELITSNLSTALNGAYAASEATLQAVYNTSDSASTIIAASTIGSGVKTITDQISTIVTAKDSNVYGYTNVYLEGDRVFGRTQEVNLGNITADANAWKARAALGLPETAAVFSLKNGGGLRASLGSVLGDGTKVGPLANPITSKPANAISQLDIENALRFNNKLMVFDTTPTGLLAILNFASGLSSGPTAQNGGYPQVGNIRFSYDSAQPAGSKVRTVSLVNEAGAVVARIVENGAVVPGAPATISCISLNFTANGGDSYPIKANADNFRYLLTNGTLSAAVSEALDFTATATFTGLGLTAADIMGEQKAFQDFLAARHATAGAAYTTADTPVAQDTRIQQLAQNGNVDTVNGPPVVSLALANVGVNKTEASVTLSLTRTGGTAATSVLISTTDGTAVAGVDYTGKTDEVVNFAANSNTATVTISLSAAAITSSKEFTATISSNGAATLGAITTTTVRIKADTTAPTVAVTAPGNSATVKEPLTTTAKVTISGTITGDSTDTVSISINGGAAIPATRTGSNAWSVTFTGTTAANAALVGGNNTVVATATDLDGNVGTSAPRTFFYEQLRDITVTSTNGTVTFVPGLVAGKAAVGKLYTLSAKPNVAFFFSNWTGTAGFSSTTTSSTTFTFVEANNTVTANFVASPFNLAGGVNGTYNGIVKGSAAADTQANAGILNVLVALNTGAFTGKLNLDGNITTVAGVFNNVDGTFVTPTVSNGVVYNLDLDFTTKVITGTITKRKRGADVSVVNVNAPQAYTTAAFTPAVAYNVAFSAPDAPAELLSDEYPHGNGYGVLTISANAGAKLVGVLADGTAFTSSSVVCKPVSPATENTVPVYASFAAAKGALVGNATITAAAAVTGTDFRWFKSENSGQYYPYGFALGADTGLTIDIAAGGLQSAATAPTLTTVSFSGGGFASSSIAVGTNPKISFKPTTNVMSGSYTNASGSNLIGGIVVGSTAYGYILTPLPKHFDGSGQGGLVAFP